MKRIFQIISISIFTLSFSNQLKSQTYCSPTFSSGCTFSNYISSVNVGGMSNTASGCTVTNFINKIATIVAGDTISMSVGVAGWDGITVFVDLNNDGDFTDTLEMLYKKYNAFTPPHAYSFTITVPDTTMVGNHRMRVLCGNGGSGVNNNPCVNIAYGTFHDYTLKITNNCPYDTISTITNVTDSTANFSWVSVPGASGYEHTIDLISKSPNINGTPTTSTSHAATGLAKGLKHYFHLRTNCGNNIYSGWIDTSFVTCIAPNATINKSDSVALCTGDTLELIANSDTNIFYQWYRNNLKMSGKNSSSLSVTTASKYFVIEQVLGGCADTSEIAIVFDAPLPTPSITQNGTKLNTSRFYKSFQWYYNGNPIPGAVDSSHTAQLNGMYFVRVTNINGCSANTDSVEVINAGVNDLENSLDIKVYPNPFTNNLTIQFENNLENVTVKLMSTEGKLIYTETNIHINQVDLNLNSVDRGIYFLSISSNSGRYIQKVVKE